MRQWAEAALGRRQVARAMRRLVLDGFAIRDVLVDGDSAQLSDRLIVGPQGLFVVGFRTVPGNVWRGGRPESSSESLAAHAQATHRLSEVVLASLQPELERVQIGVTPLLALIGPEQLPGAQVGGLPLLGPAGLLDYVSTGPHVLTPMQIDRLADRVDDWLALRSATNFRARGGPHNGPRGRPRSL